MRFKESHIKKYICSECGKVGQTHWSHNQVTCSRKCYSKRRSRIYIGSKHPQWKGGVCNTKKKCELCKKSFFGLLKRKFCSRSCQVRFKSLGSKNPRWKGGRIKDKDGYITLLKPNHPNAKKSGYILEHRFILSEILGRPLLKNEIIHHKNEIKDDNRLENLLLMSKKEHDRFHTIKRHQNEKLFS